MDNVRVIIFNRKFLSIKQILENRNEPIKSDIWITECWISVVLWFKSENFAKKC